MLMRYPGARVRGSVLTFGLALCASGCGGGLKEGVPSDINPNRPPPQVSARLEAANSAAKQALERRAQSKGKRGTGTPAVSSPKKVREQGD